MMRVISGSGLINYMIDKPNKNIFVIGAHERVADFYKKFLGIFPIVRQSDVDDFIYFKGL